MNPGSQRCAAAALALLGCALSRAETPPDLASATVEPAIVRVEGDTV